MTPDPKEELGARFDNRRPSSEEEDEKEVTEGIDNTDNTDNTDNPNNTDNSDNTSDADSSQENDAGVSDDSDNTDNTGSDGKPGPSRDEDATRHRRQVPMYLSEEKAEMINSLYERLDGRSKVVGDGGIEKHADFMEEIVEFAAENEEELAKRLGIDLT